jgi:ArsR family transcriptional regulator
MLIAAPSLFDSFTALSDATRCRLLALIEHHELTVSELCAVLQLPQSTVSRHLKLLADAGWVSSRRDGTSRYYTLALDGAGGPRSQIWDLTKPQVAARVGAAQDSRRLARVLAGRGEASQQFFATAAGQWDRLRQELFGADFLPGALLGLLPSTWTIGDLGCGTGALLPLLAPHVAHVVGVDASREMLATARARVKDLPNVELHHGTLESLPLADASLDAVTCVLVLHHVPAPGDALAEAHRVLKPGGRLLVVDMQAHDREDYRQRMGHVWLGFSEDQMRRYLAQTGFDHVSLHSLPPSQEAKGPTLFAAAASKHILNERPVHNEPPVTNN